MTIKVYKAKKIKNPKGEIIKFLDNKSKYFLNFGEVYFNVIKRNKISDWIYHKKNQCIFLCIKGSVKFKVKEKSKEKVITISKKNNKILIISPRNWFKFNSNSSDSIIVNLINIKHNDNEVKKNLVKQK
jgi:hypothetical protein